MPATAPFLSDGLKIRTTLALIGTIVAAVVGSAFYGTVALIERWVTFWHPSQRG